MCDGAGGLRETRLEGAAIPNEPGWLWIHLDRRDSDHQRWLRERSGLDPLMCEALLEEETRPRVLADEELDHLMVFLRGVNRSTRGDPDELVSLRMWLEPQRVISLRHERLRVLNPIRKRMEKGKGPRTPGDLLAEVARRLIDQQSKVVDALQDTVDEIEERLAEEAGYALRGKIAEFRRAAIGLRRYIAPQRDVLSSLIYEPASWLDKRNRARLREVAERQSRLIEEVDSSRERASVSQEEVNGRLSEQMNRNMYLLSLIAGVFLPLGLLTGLLGINVGGMPGAEESNAFWLVCALLVALAGVMLWFFRRARML